MRHRLDERFLPLLRTHSRHRYDELLSRILLDGGVARVGVTISFRIDSIRVHVTRRRQPAFFYQNSRQVIRRRYAGVALVREGSGQPPSLMREGVLDRILAHGAQLLAGRRRQDGSGAQCNGECRCQGDNAGRHHERVVVDQFCVQRVHGGDMRDILAFCHAVREDPHVELHLTMDDVELVFIEPSRQAGIDDASLPFVENVILC